MMCRYIRFILTSLLFSLPFSLSIPLLSSSDAAFAAIIHVPGDQPTIQAGIDAAQVGDTVLVAPGTYSGDGNRDLDFHGTNLVLLSDGIGQATIDCSTADEVHRGLVLQSGEDTTSVIEGFVITGANVSGYWEGAVTFRGAGGTLRNCTVTGNACRGITASLTAPDYFRYRVYIERCLVQGNHQGIVSMADGAISDCSVLYNDSTGILLSYMDSITVTDCLIAGNARYGIATYTGGCGHYRIANNTVVLNEVGYYFYYDPPKEGLPEAGLREPSPIIANLFAFNSAKGFESDGLGVVCAAVTCNNAYGNPVADWDTYYDHEPHAGDTLGNISMDPLFCDLDTSYSVSNLSPCLPANNGCRVWIGAYGVGCDFICGDVNGDGGGPVVSDLTFLIAHLFRGGAAPVMEPADVDDDNDLDVADLSYMIGYLFRTGPAPVCS